MHLQSCSFANLNLLLFLLLQNLPIVVIQTFGYHGNVLSRFSSLLFLTNTCGRFQFFFLKKQQRNGCTMEFHQAYEFNVTEPRV